MAVRLRWWNSQQVWSAPLVAAAASVRVGRMSCPCSMVRTVSSTGEMFSVSSALSDREHVTVNSGGEQPEGPDEKLAEPAAPAATLPLHPTVGERLDRAAETLTVMLHRTNKLSRDVHLRGVDDSTGRAMRDLRVTCLQVADLFDTTDVAVTETSTPHQQARLT